ncbi:hypothetical protein SAMN04488058_101164 [Deinococcus reticulitermitis]|uniref:Uncharacterized protein n=1 Tax=Deinococcus reticulitermitis TaxID=856736 RepID=A0A1H6SFU5_9DEIO|nr:hypothetical protein [Deinococcus reticulitermitis]SEI62322.1 hypothetical protein SAMN04488058_101164 [Deinococcus reticulitermitis]
MNRTRSFLLALTVPLMASAVAVNTSGVVVGGAVVGNVAPETRLSAWVVTPFGQPVQLLAETALAGDTFRLTLPDTAPQDRLRVPVDERTAWPGLVDFAGASVQARAAELKFFTYRDANGNGKRDEAEPLREVRLNAGKGELFMVWATPDVSVRGGGGYEANLKSGWNALVVEVRRPVRIAPYTGQPLQINVGR